MKIFLFLLFISIAIYITMMVWYVRPYKALNWLCHDIMGWHIHDNYIECDGCSWHSHCKICGEKITQDSQGNWFISGRGNRAKIVLEEIEENGYSD